MGPPAGTEVGGSEGLAQGAAGVGMLCSIPFSLDAVEGEHSLHVLRQSLGLWPLKAINDRHDVLATAQCCHDLLQEAEGRDKAGFPSWALGPGSHYKEQ